MTGAEQVATEARLERRPMFALAWWHLPAVVAGSYLLRLLNVGRVSNYLEDAYINAPGALHYIRFGVPGPDNWFTQPAKHVTMYLSILLFGNDPFGWSMRQVLMGTGVVVLTFLLARRVFRVPFPALFAALVVALDPTWIAFSRAGSEDPSAVFFMLWAMLLWVRGMQEDSDWSLLGAGALVGIAIATRWYVMPVAGIMLLLTLAARRRQGAAGALKSIAQLAMIPAATYLWAFLPLALHGRSLGDIVSLNVDAYAVQQTGAYPAFGPELQAIAGPSGWFTRWMAVWNTGPRVSGWGSFTVLMNDPVVWFLFVPSVLYLLWVASRRRAAEFWLVGLSFVLTYGFFFSVRRPIYLYSALSLVPLGAMSLGFVCGRLLKRGAVVVLAFVAAWCAYLYPLASALSVPLALYGWFLRFLGVAGGPT